MAGWQQKWCSKTNRPCQRTTEHADLSVMRLSGSHTHTNAHRRRGLGRIQRTRTFTHAGCTDAPHTTERSHALGGGPSIQTTDGAGYTTPDLSSAGEERGRGGGRGRRRSRETTEASVCNTVTGSGSPNGAHVSRSVSCFCSMTAEMIQRRHRVSVCRGLSSRNCPTTPR